MCDSSHTPPSGTLTHGRPSACANRRGRLAHDERRRLTGTAAAFHGPGRTVQRPHREKAPDAVLDPPAADVGGVEAGHRRGEIDPLRGPPNPREPDQQPYVVQQRHRGVVGRRQRPAELVNHGVEHGRRQIGGLHLVDQGLRLGREVPAEPQYFPMVSSVWRAAESSSSNASVSSIDLHAASRSRNSDWSVGNDAARHDPFRSRSRRAATIRRTWSSRRDTASPSARSAVSAFSTMPSIGCASSSPRSEARSKRRTSLGRRPASDRADKSRDETACSARSSCRETIQPSLAARASLPSGSPSRVRQECCWMTEQDNAAMSRCDCSRAGTVVCARWSITTWSCRRAPSSSERRLKSSNARRRAGGTFPRPFFRFTMGAKDEASPPSSSGPAGGTAPSCVSGPSSARLLIASDRGITATAGARPARSAAARSGRFQARRCASVVATYAGRSGVASATRSRTVSSEQSRV